MKNFICIFLSFVILAAGCGVTDDTEGNVVVGDRLPHFAVTLSDGAIVTDADLLGKVNLIAFFTVTCPDCQETLPELQKIYDRYSKQISVLLISRAEDYEVVMPYWKENGFTMPVSPQKNRSVYELFAKSIVPRVYICSRDNVVKAIHTDSPNPTYDEMSEEIKSLL